MEHMHEPVRIPKNATLEKTRHLAAGCKACDLWRSGTQTVFGEGSEHAQVMLVGEQPGNSEDLAGRPFVGPAGKTLDRALERARIARDDVYVTNVVKHFKWTPKGKLRIHKKPNTVEVEACRPWLETEIAIIRPRVLVCLGATAAQALLGRKFLVSRQHGQFVESQHGPAITATIHPSAVLRAPTEEDRDRLMNQLVDDMTRVAQRLRDM